MSRRRPVVIPPGELAQTDQDLALLADLTGRARRHAPHCPIPVTCPGPATAALLEETDCPTRDRVCCSSRSPSWPPVATAHRPSRSWSTRAPVTRAGRRVAAVADVRPRPSVHDPITKSYAIDQITDIEHLRRVAHRMWEAFAACHAQSAHSMAVLTGFQTCEPCQAHVGGERDTGCEQYQQWQRKISDGFGSA
jgi:hypothetical protein